MSTFEFYFQRSALKKAADYLKSENVELIEGKSEGEILQLIQDTVIKCFEKHHTKDPKRLSSINDDGTLHGGIVWRGLNCCFASINSCSGSSELIKVGVEFPNNWNSNNIISVDFYLNL